MAVSGAGARAKGNRAEVALAKWLRVNGFPWASTVQRGSAGSDIGGTPGIAWECKAQERVNLAAWADQAEAQRQAEGASLGVVVIRRRGKPDPGDWYAVVPLDAMAGLLRDAGWGAAA